MIESSTPSAGARALIVCGGTHGHTAKIAAHIAHAMHEEGLCVDVLAVEHAADATPTAYDVTVVFDTWSAAPTGHAEVQRVAAVTPKRWCASIEHERGAERGARDDAGVPGVRAWVGQPVDDDERERARAPVRPWSCELRLSSSRDTTSASTPTTAAIATQPSRPPRTPRRAVRRSHDATFSTSAGSAIA